MKERPILFSAPMVLALLNGSKTQTRREVKKNHAGRAQLGGKNWHLEDPNAIKACPYGQPGDRLWVRENGWERPERTPKMMREGADTWAPYYYDADGYNSDHDKAQLKEWGFKRRPSIHMPRWASRITLEITGVRVERLQDISESDAKAEGARPYLLPVHPARENHRHVDGYQTLWESINGPGSWDANQWVWVIEFKVVMP